MHAFLIVGNNPTARREEARRLADRLKAKIMEFPLVKIEDVRNLGNLIRLSFSEPTLIVSENIHEAGIPALNAFLKNLEEPQENIYFALTTSSTRKVLSTIVSRCQIVTVKSSEFTVNNEDEIKGFMEMKTGQRIAFFDKIRDRNEALDFVNALIFFLHREKKLENMEILLKTITGLKANGNVNLQLTNLAINYNG